MNEALRTLLKHELPDVLLNLGNLEEEENSYYVSKEKFKDYHNYEFFIDSDGSKLGLQDLEKIKVDYESVVFSNFHGWGLASESNQFPLFSSMFTTSENTYQLYDKKGLWSFAEYSGTEMFERSEFRGHFPVKEVDIVVGRGDVMRRLQEHKGFTAHSRVTLQALWETGLPGVVFDNKYLVKAPSAYLSQMFVRNIEEVERRNFIMYASTVDSLNNQLSFAKLVEQSSVQDNIILFCGKIVDTEYARAVSETLNKKSIRHLFLGRVPHHIFAYLYLMSQSLIRYASIDYGPRCVSEGLWAGLPFVVNNRIIMPDELMRYGVSCKANDKEELNQAIQKTLSENLHREIHEHCKQNLTLVKTYSKFIEDINQVYLGSI